MKTTDFEAMPIGTGAELARLNDLAQELLSVLMRCDDAGLFDLKTSQVCGIDHKVRLDARAAIKRAGQ